MYLLIITFIDELSGDTAADMALVRRVQQGDHDAFRLLMEIYAPRIQRVIYHRVGNVADVDDAQQEVFIRFYKYLPKFRGDASIFTLLYRIALRTCADMYHDVQRLPELIDDKYPAGIERDDVAESAEMAVLRRERQAAIRQLIGQIRVPFRDVYVLSEIEGYTDKEIASMLNINIGTVKSRLSRARNEFNKMIFENEELFLD
ncbi:MAG: RNA polymerase sigma factor [bacterium]